MRREDCRVGLVVQSGIEGVRGVVVKCNPKKARVRLIEDMKSGRHGGEKGSLWNMPYMYLEPLVDPRLKTEMVMRSFEDPDNEGIKTYIEEVLKSDQSVDFPEGSPEFHIMRAICELWRRLEDESIEREAASMEGRRDKNERELKAHYSELINKMFSALGREISKDASEKWETGNMETRAVDKNTQENWT